jgi:D-alanyl-lipoteichoic acid acyltransferase DltB (MBOAT superfamily)
MLFSSFAFLLAFLPATCAGYFLVGKLSARSAALAWLTLCSMAFYGASNPLGMVVMLLSIVVNYRLAIVIGDRLHDGPRGRRVASRLFIIGAACNVALLGYFKYKNFFLSASNELLGTQLTLHEWILPLGISFLTFKQIAFLADARAGKIRPNALDYLCFVFFFPQVVAGPIVHYGEVVPQFQRLRPGFDARDIAAGVCLFSIGLFKKAVLADGSVPYVLPAFSAADDGRNVQFVWAWIGALAFTLEIYFDFSGYSDMALGLGRLFGIRLPVNFNSPLKSSSIVDFWSRWHITLTRFLTAYIYLPVMLRLSRRRREAGKPTMRGGRLSVGAFFGMSLVPSLLTMLVSGIWHGAGLTFVLWGLLHGAYICINQAWRYWRPRWPVVAYERWMVPLGFGLTFVAVVAGSVLFRAHTLGSAGRMIHAMLGLDGVSLPIAVLGHLGPLGQLLQSFGVTPDPIPGRFLGVAALFLAALTLIATLGPNSNELVAGLDPEPLTEPGKESPKERRGSSVDDRPAHMPGAAAVAASPSAGMNVPLTAWRMRYRPAWALAVATMFVLGCCGINRVSQFLYWQF